MRTPSDIAREVAKLQEIIDRSTMMQEYIRSGTIIGAGHHKMQVRLTYKTGSGDSYLKAWDVDSPRTRIIAHQLVELERELAAEAEKKIDELMVELTSRKP
jgi:hypothetical protein